MESEQALDKPDKPEKNIMDSCRVCMAYHPNMKEIFDSDANNNISYKIEFCSGIQVSKEDGMPSHICDSCLLDLGVAHKFKTLCILADETFRKLLVAKSVKLETVEDVDVMNYDDCNEGDIKEEVSDEGSINSDQKSRVQLKEDIERDEAACTAEDDSGHLTKIDENLVNKDIDVAPNTDSEVDVYTISDDDGDDDFTPTGVSSIKIIENSVKSINVAPDTEIKSEVDANTSSDDDDHNDDIFTPIDVTSIKIDESLVNRDIDVAPNIEIKSEVETNTSSDDIMMKTSRS